MTKNKGQNSWKSRRRHHDSWCQCLSKYHVTHNVILIKWCKNSMDTTCLFLQNLQNHMYSSKSLSEFLASTPSVMVLVWIFAIDTITHGVNPNFWHWHHQSWCWSEFLALTPWVMVSVWIIGINTMSHGVGLNFWHPHHESWCRSEFLALTPWFKVLVWIFGSDTMSHGVSLNFCHWHHQSWCRISEAF